MKAKYIILIIIIVVSCFLLYVVVSFGFLQSAFHISKAEKCISTYRNSFEVSMRYIEDYTEEQRWTFWRLVKGKVLEQTYAGREEALIIDGKENIEAFDMLCSAGVRSIEYDRDKGYFVFVFQSGLSKSKGILYYTGDTDNLSFYDLPYETVSLKKTDGEYGWYYYTHETKD